MIFVLVDDLRWDDFGAASARIVHTDLRDVLRDAAAFLRDPALRGGFDPAVDLALGECFRRIEHVGVDEDQR